MFERSLLHDVTRSIVEADHVTKSSIEVCKHRILVGCIEAFSLPCIKVNESFSSAHDLDVVHKVNGTQRRLRLEGTCIGTQV